jgi:hypothetical protein
MTHLRPSQVGPARMLREWHGHLLVTAPGTTESERARAAYDEMKYEIGYTVLHRLSALRMAEEREIVQACVRQGRDSAGFKLFMQIAGDVDLGTRDEAYAFFLARIYDDLALDLPAVFDRRSAASLIFPGSKAMDEVLGALNDPGLTVAWTEDETLGWIFEDYNDAEERKEMRKHDAPRNARELAVRNQFFTPRWVVEFLTDNTLARLWVELTAGETSLVEKCRFLAKVSELPTRAPRDPRDITVLDPACGSGHFLLYVFDVLETIYEEAWNGRTQRSPGRKPLWEEFPEEAAFLAEIPRLILAHNLHGVDIDPRCLQEAALALWLRAHRSWQRLGLRARDRPGIAQVSLVCAQAMPNAPALRAELLGKLKPPVLGRLAEALLARAGEMGVLLRAETAMADTVATVKKEYRAWKQAQQLGGKELFEDFAAPRQMTIEDFAELWDDGDEEAFWEDAEARLKKALEEVTEGAEDGAHYRSRLFAEDVRHGLEFFELSRRKFDVILMNPPFGAPSEGTKAALDLAYPDSNADLYAMFYERTLEMLEAGGRVGAITNRSWLALSTLEAFRKRILGAKGTVELAADLGYGVLNAKVETAAAIVRQGEGLDVPAMWIRLVKTGRKCDVLLDALRTGTGHRWVSVRSARQFETLPVHVYGYWLSAALAKVYADSKTVESVADVKQGTATADDPRFLRLAWEVQPSAIGLTTGWARFAKGGESRMYFDDVHLVIRWKDAGKEVAAFEKAYIRNPQYNGRRGATWPRRTNLRISPRSFPEGCAFGDKGPVAIPSALAPASAILGILCSSPAFLLATVRLHTADDSPKAISKSYEVGIVRDLPWPMLDTDAVNRLGISTAAAAELMRVGQLEDDETGETCVAFAALPLLEHRSLELGAAVRQRLLAREASFVQLAKHQSSIDAIVAEGYAFSSLDWQVMEAELEPALSNLPAATSIDDELLKKAYLSKGRLDGARLPGGLDAEFAIRVEHRRGKQTQPRSLEMLCRIFHAAPATLVSKRAELNLLRPEDLQRSAADILSYAVGAAFGRWDVRLATHPEWTPTFADPFDPMPACPLGQLVNGEGLPASPARIASEAWLAARKHPTSLPPPDEVDAGSYPVAVAWDGMLSDDTLDDARARPPETSLLARVEAVLEHLFGAARPTWEADIADALGVDSIGTWLRTPKHFFQDHLSRYSKSRRQAPIYWPLSTESGSLTTWIYAPRLDANTLPSLINRIRTGNDDLRDERDRPAKHLQTDRALASRHTLLQAAVAERQILHDRLAALVARGYEPHADDGFVVTAAPLHFAFLLPKWRDVLRASFASLERGELDWAHLAMRFRPAEVRAKCRSDLSLAIAHGLEAEYEAPVGKKSKKQPAVPKSKVPSRKRPAKTQAVLPGTESKETK